MYSYGKIPVIAHPLLTVKRKDLIPKDLKKSEF